MPFCCSIIKTSPTVSVTKQQNEKPLSHWVNAAMVEGLVLWIDLLLIILFGFSGGFESIDIWQFDND